MRKADETESLCDVWKAVVATGAMHPDASTRAACRDAVRRALAGQDGVAPVEAFAAEIARLANDPLEPLELDEGGIWAAWALLHGSAFMHLRVAGRAVLTEDAGTLVAYRRGKLVAEPADPAADAERSRAGWFRARRFDCWNARAARGGFANASLIERGDPREPGLAIQIPTPQRLRRDRLANRAEGGVAIGSVDLLDPWIEEEHADAWWSSDSEHLTRCGARIERTSSAIHLTSGRPEAAMRLLARLAGPEELIPGLRHPVGLLWGAEVGSTRVRFCRAFELVPSEWARLRRMRPIEVEPALRSAIARWYGVPRSWATREFFESIGPIGRSD